MKRALMQSLLLAAGVLAAAAPALAQQKDKFQFRLN
jgi:hypothetical protein